MVLTFDPQQEHLRLPSFGDRQDLRQKVTDALRSAVVVGQLRPGVVYSAVELAAQFHVSTTPVRGAMHDLVKERLVAPVPNKGFRVTELSVKDLDDIADVRALIEVPTISELARRCDSTMALAVNELRPLARTLRRHAADSHLVAYVEADKQFHLRLLALSGNRPLVQVVEGLRTRSRLHGLDARACLGHLRTSASEHEHLVDLILAADAEGAAALMHRHIARVRGT